MTDAIIRMGIDPTAEIEKFNLVVEFSMDKIIEVDQGMDKAIGMTSGEKIIKGMQEHIKIRILEDEIIEVDIEETTEMIIMKEVEVGLEKGHIQVIFKGMTEVTATVGQGQDQEQAPIETE